MITDRLKAFAQPLIEGLGFEYWGAEYLSGEALLRVYIDSPKGISVDDCAAVSRELSVILDVEDIVANQYRLEISSPGVDRPFFSFEQYEEFIGFKVQLKLRYPFEGRRNFKGVLSLVDEEASELGVVIDEEEYLLPYEQIEKGRLLADISAEKS